jgi:DNA-binding response OmpR family regulator
VGTLTAQRIHSDFDTQVRSSADRLRDRLVVHTSLRNERIVVPRQRLLEEVWGYDPFATTNTIEVFVSNLRRKLEAGDEPRLLHTIRGAGYVLRA